MDHHELCATEFLLFNVSKIFLLSLKRGRVNKQDSKLAIKKILKRQKHTDCYCDLAWIDAKEFKVEDSFSISFEL